MYMYMYMYMHMYMYMYIWCVCVCTISHKYDTDETCNSYTMAASGYTRVASSFEATSFPPPNFYGGSSWL